MNDQDSIISNFEISARDDKNSTTGEKQFIIPERYRKMENLHIFFWLVKDISWCMIWKPLGLFMILPTLTFAVVILIRTRRYMSEFCHNLAVVLWIVANSYWMISEFYVFDGYPLGYNDYSYKDLTIIPFILGILVLGFYYLWWKPRNKELVETM